MTTIQHATSPLTLIAASHLEKSPLNVRRTAAQMGLAELKASLLAHGLMQNLVVTDAGEGSYRVIAGGRRLDAIRALQAEGKLPEDFAVPCQIVSEDRARELSLAENTVRLAMHPADQFVAFAALIEAGASAAEVAQRFGVDESLVLKRMKLGRVAPQLLAEYRSDRLTLESLMAFAVTDDHTRQLKVFKALPDWQKDNPHAIRSALTEKMIEAGDKLARFVGVEAYEAAGGATRADLFGDEVYLEQPALLHKLAEQKLDVIRTELEAEGWGWIEVQPDRDYDAIHRCGRLQPHLIDAPADGTRALAGCFLSIDPDGTPCIDKGLVKPEHRKLLAKLLSGGDSEPSPAKPKHALPETLRRDLAAERRDVAQLSLARHPEIAFDLLAFRAASAWLGKHRVTDGPNVAFNQPRPSRESTSSAAARELDTLRETLPMQWLNEAAEAERFASFCALPQAAKLELLAYCVALTLQPKLGPNDGMEVTAYDAALARTAASVADYWRPAKDNFLNRRTRGQLLAIGGEMFGEPWAHAHAGDKKAQLAEQLDRAFSKPEASGRTPEQIERLKHWLPAGMPFDLPAAPKPAKGKKARKAA